MSGSAATSTWWATRTRSTAAFEDRDGDINIRGLNHPKRVFDLTEGLIRRGYTDAQIAQVLGGNAIRVLGTIWPA